MYSIIRPKQTELPNNHDEEETKLIFKNKQTIINTKDAQTIVKKLTKLKHTQFKDKTNQQHYDCFIQLKNIKL